MMDDYYLLRRPDDKCIEIAKFQGHNEPVAVYTVKGKICNCPARGRCKHHFLVERWKALEEAPVALYEDDTYDIAVPGILEEYDCVDWLYDQRIKQAAASFGKKNWK